MTASKHKRQIIVLYVSTLLGVLLGVLSSIVNTNALDPIDYGDVRYVQNIINFIATFLLLGYFVSGARLMALSDDKRYVSRVKGMMIIILALACVLLGVSLGVCYFLHTDRPAVAKLFLVSIPVCAFPLFMNYIDFC
mgnify:FL=1